MPKADRSIPSRDEDRLTFLEETDGGDTFCIDRPETLLAGRDVPHPRSVLHRAGSQPLAVRAESQAEDGPVVSFKRHDPLARLQVPDFDRRILSRPADG